MREQWQGCGHKQLVKLKCQMLAKIESTAGEAAGTGGEVRGQFWTR